MKGSNSLFDKYGSILKGCEVFQGMNEDEWEELLEIFHEEEWPKNSCIINSNKFLFHFYIVLEGRIKMYQVDQHSEKEHTLFLLMKGDALDLFCLLDGCIHRVFYECLDDMKVLTAPMDKVRTWLEKNPKHYQHFLSYAGKMMRALENNVSQLIFTDISTRLLKLLLDNINKNSQELEHINDLPNKEIANLIGSTRAVVNRHIQRLKKNGSIKVSRNQVKIQDLKLLLQELENEKNKP